MTSLMTSRNGSFVPTTARKEEKEFYFKATLLRNDKTSQTTPRGHHPGPRRGEVLCTRPGLSALAFFKCQAKTMKGTKVLTSMMVSIKGGYCAHGP
jgi:hypothetical protein